MTAELTDWGGIKVEGEYPVEYSYEMIQRSIEKTKKLQVVRPRRYIFAEQIDKKTGQAIYTAVCFDTAKSQEDALEVHREIGIDYLCGLINREVRRDKHVAIIFKQGTNIDDIFENFNSYRNQQQQ